MDEEKNKINEELDCLVTVNDGSYMTCDMIEQESSDNEEKKEDYKIQRRRQRPDPGFFQGNKIQQTRTIYLILIALSVQLRQAAMLADHHNSKDDPDEDQDYVQRKEGPGREGKKLDPDENRQGGNPVAHADEE